MNLNPLYLLYLSTVFVAWCTSIHKFDRLDQGARLISNLLGLTFLAECLAFLFAVFYHNNLVVYGVFSLIQIFILALYFNQTIDVFHRKRIGVWIGMLGVSLGVINSRYFQPLHSYNSYFLFLESILVISMSLFSFARLMLQDSGQRIIPNPHFWIAAILTFFWSATFFNWGFYEYMFATRPKEIWIVNVLLLAVNICTYGALGIVFYRYPALPPRKS